MSKWIAEFELEDGDTMPEHMDLNYMGAKIDFHCRPMWISVSKKNPIKSDYYLATIKESSGEKVVRSVWYDGEWKLISVIQNVIAWQPLPDYYRAESENKT